MMFFNSIEKINKLRKETKRLLRNDFNSIKETNRFIKETNRLLSKGMSNIYLYIFTYIVTYISMLLL